MINMLSEKLFHPLWDIKDKSIKLKTWRELEKTQWMPEKELKARQWERLKYILMYAYENCEYYRMIFDENKITPFDISLPQDLLKIPVLTKKNIKDNTCKLISRLYSKDRLITAKTGGSTGTSLTVYFDKKCQEMRNAAAMRSDKWAGWKPGMIRASIWGNPEVADNIKKKIRNMLLDRIIYLDTMNINEKSMENFANDLRKNKSSVIFGHAHSIFVFARFLQEKNINNIRPKGIISTSMMLLPSERRVIEEVFECKVINRYGCEEVGLIACECERHEGMHLNIDHLYIEFIKDDGTTAKQGEEGNIVVTDLINKGMPLIRYKVGDVGIPADKECSCGRGIPMMKRVTGRVADFLIRKDGSLVAGISLVERTLTAIKGIDQLQIVQEDINEIILNVVRMKGYDSSSEQQLLEEFLNVFGKNVNIKIIYLRKILQERSGKYRFSICKIKDVH